ncbi:MAG: hypothetical protein NVSMB42_18490 [Herpetosiphon sp.]
MRWNSQPLTAIGADFDSIIQEPTEWSDACILAPSFPRDVLKRVAG